jgi:[acyl-carrier-protein] S-malonyltransferase
VLAGLARRIDADIITATVLDPASLAQAKGLLG